MQETWLWSFSQEEPLEKGMATTPVFLPGEFLGQRNCNKIHLYDSNGKGDLFRKEYSRYMVQYKHLFLKASVV